jgi:hypothetical protein
VSGNALPSVTSFLPAGSTPLAPKSS